MKPELISVQQGQAEYRLSENHPLRLAHAAGQQIECLDGTAWITAYDQETDFVLRRGQSFEVPNDGLMLIEAVGASAVRVRLPSRPSSRWRRAVGFLLRN
jgi:hypothetical protein